MAGGPGTLILTLTRQCNLRCAYCPTVKDNWPSLRPDQIDQAIDLFVNRFGGGDIKLFGGEPLLVPDAVDHCLDLAERLPQVRRIYLSTNGLGLTPALLQRLQGLSKPILTISIDGEGEDHRRFRRPLSHDTPDSHDHLTALLPELIRTPRVVVTQTIPPATASRAMVNLRALLGMGFTRFNLLPGYYLPWKPAQREALQRSLTEIAALIAARWEAGQPFYLRNLFTRAPTPFFNTGLIVDADGSIHPSNLGLSQSLDTLRARTQVGDLDHPPTLEQLALAASQTARLLEETLPPEVWESTLFVDRLLTDLCNRLYPAYFRQRRARPMEMG